MFEESLPPQFTALQLAILALGGKNPTLIDAHIAIAPLSDALKVKLNNSLENGSSFLKKNPYLTREQELLLIAQLAAVPAWHIAEEFARVSGYSDDEIEFLAAAFAGCEVHAEPTQFFHPGSELIELVTAISGDLTLGLPARKVLPSLKAHHFAHPWDVEAIRKMREVTGFETILRKYSEFHTERLALLNSEALRIRVSSKQFPEVFRVFEECCDRAGQKELPDLFIQNGGMGAFVDGIKRPQIVLSSALVSLLTPRELMFVIGHELGHIRCEHLLYLQLARMLPAMSAIVADATLGFGRLLSTGVQLGVLDWYRKAEFSADRFGLLVCQDEHAAMSTLMKCAGAPPAFFGRMSADAFVEQGRKYQFDYQDTQNVLYKFMLTAEMDHPWPTVRAWQLRDWFEGGAYDALVNHGGRFQVTSGNYGKVSCSSCSASNEPTNRFCEECGEKLLAASRTECEGCGQINPPANLFCEGCGVRIQT